jgi:hypothetical protein
MADELMARLLEVEARLDALGARQTEEVRAAVSADAERKLGKVLDCLNRLLAGAADDSTVLRQVTPWAELEDALDGLRAMKGELPEGTFRRLWLCAREARGRLLQGDGADPYAVAQLAYAGRVIGGVLKRTGSH